MKLHVKLNKISIQYLLVEDPINELMDEASRETKQNIDEIFISWRSHSWTNGWSFIQLQWYDDKWLPTKMNKNRPIIALNSLTSRPTTRDKQIDIKIFLISKT